MRSHYATTPPPGSIKVTPLGKTDAMIINARAILTVIVNVDGIVLVGFRTADRKLHEVAVRESAGAVQGQMKSALAFWAKMSSPERDKTG